MTKYEVIYADPPWRYGHSRSNSRQIENHYPTMTLDAICKLPVKNISSDNAVLYLWATAPKLPEALQVIKSWGFEYVTQAIWDKEIIGMGYWFRGQHEILIVAKRGKFSPPESSKRTSSVIKEKRTKHSKKPGKVKDMISDWFPDKTKIELFCRSKEIGWHSWGNEIESDIKMKDYDQEK